LARFFTDPFPVRLRPAFAYDYVIAFSHDIERECICAAPIEVTLSTRYYCSRAHRAYLRQARELCVGRWAHMSSYLGPLSYMQWRHVHWCAELRRLPASEREIMAPRDIDGLSELDDDDLHALAEWFPLLAPRTPTHSPPSSPADEPTPNRVANTLVSLPRVRFDEDYSDDDSDDEDDSDVDDDSDPSEPVVVTPITKLQSRPLIVRSPLVRMALDKENAPENSPLATGVAPPPTCTPERREPVRRVLQPAAMLESPVAPKANVAPPAQTPSPAAPAPKPVRRAALLESPAAPAPPKPTVAPAPAPQARRALLPLPATQAAAPAAPIATPTPTPPRRVLGDITNTTAQRTKRQTPTSAPSPLLPAEKPRVRASIKPKGDVAAKQPTPRKRVRFAADQVHEIPTRAQLRAMGTSPVERTPEKARVVDIPSSISPDDIKRTIRKKTGQEKENEWKRELDLVQRALFEIDQEQLIEELIA
jgi:hypothetical protein